MTFPIKVTSVCFGGRYNFGILFFTILPRETELLVLCILF
jgi:hypothetical protein